MIFETPRDGTKSEWLSSPNRTPSSTSAKPGSLADLWAGKKRTEEPKKGLQVSGNR